MSVWLMRSAICDRGLSFREVADRLTEDGHTSRRDKPWNPTQVKRVLERIRARE
jgi:hypothetical protein